MSSGPKSGRPETDDDIIIEYFHISEIMDAWSDGYNHKPPLL
jgi:hypothetical protein